VVTSSGNIALVFLESKNSFVVVGTKIGIVGMRDRKLEFRLLSFLAEFQGEISMLSKINLVITDCANDDTVKRLRIFWIITTVHRKDVVFRSCPLSSSKKSIRSSILRKQEKFSPFERTTEGRLANEKKDKLLIDNGAHGVRREKEC